MGLIDLVAPCSVEIIRSLDYMGMVIRDGTRIIAARSRLVIYPQDEVEPNQDIEVWVDPQILRVGNLTRVKTASGGTNYVLKNITDYEYDTPRRIYKPLTFQSSRMLTKRHEFYAEGWAGIVVGDLFWDQGMRRINRTPEQQLITVYKQSPL